MNGVYVKAPEARLDYAFEWKSWLGTDTIASFEIASELTITDVTEVNGMVTYWAEGGVHNTDYTVTCSIVTAAGRKDERSIKILVRNSEDRIPD